MASSAVRIICTATTRWKQHPVAFSNKSPLIEVSRSIDSNLSLNESNKHAYWGPQNFNFRQIDILFALI
jgi:hypothetical protein